MKKLLTTATLLLATFGISFGQDNNKQPTTANQQSVQLQETRDPNTSYIHEKQLTRFGRQEKKESIQMNRDVNRNVAFTKETMPPQQREDRPGIKNKSRKMKINTNEPNKNYNPSNNIKKGAQ